MEQTERAEAERFASEHHVHYEVEPEVAEDAGRRQVVGYDVRLFATHGEARLPVPGCARCDALLRDLRTFAERLVASAGAGHRAEVVTGAPALYQSREVPGADEVSLTVRVRCEAPGHGTAGSAEERCLAGLSEGLRAARVPRR